MTETPALRIVEGPHSGGSIGLGDEVDIGRGATGPGRLEKDAELSQQHARVTRGPTGELLLYDLGSTNGTFLNGQRIEQSAALQTGDRIRLGQTTLEVDIPAAAPPPRVPPQGAAPPTRVHSPPATPRAAPSQRGATIALAGLPPTMKGRIFPSIGLLVVQLIVGYEWLLSALTKLFRGGFPQGLGADLTEKSKDSAEWYRDFLESVLIPQAKTFGYLIEFTELIVGVMLIVTALLWIFRWERMTSKTRDAVLLGIVGASLVAISMNIGFYLATGDPLPFFLAKSPFDEGVGLDVLLPMLELVLAGVSFWTWRSLRRARAGRSA